MKKLCKCSNLSKLMCLWSEGENFEDEIFNNEAECENMHETHVDKLEEQYNLGV